MDYQNLGRTGLKVSELCLGTMQFGWTADEDTSYQILTHAFNAGINFIDTADVYSFWAEGNPGGVAERIIGKWIQRQGIPRHEVVIATKVRGKMGDSPNDEGLSRAHVLKAVDDSLKRLNTDYIDLYQTHWFDKDTPIEETLSTLDDLVRQGKVRYIGCSNYPAWRLMESLWVSDKHNLARYDSIQPHYNLVHRSEYERDLADVCSKYQIGVIPYSPLAGGFLTGKYRKDQEINSARAGGASRYFNTQNWNLLENLETIGKANGDYSISQVSIAWMQTLPTITSPIIGPRTIDQLEDNLGSVGFKLSPSEMQILDEASQWKTEKD
jgi:aryl-alcohol dehydrogenase-like predicted oxidoreductase